MLNNSRHFMIHIIQNISFFAKESFRKFVKKLLAFTCKLVSIGADNLGKQAHSFFIVISITHLILQSFVLFGKVTKNVKVILTIQSFLINIHIIIKQNAHINDTKKYQIIFCKYFTNYSKKLKASFLPRHNLIIAYVSYSPFG